MNADQDNTLSNWMRPVLNGIYDNAFDGIDESCEAVAAGYALAREVVINPTAVRVRTYEAALFAVVGKVLTEKGFKIEDNGDLVTALQQLSYTYVKLNPRLESSGTADALTDFLDPLGRTSASGILFLDQSAAALEHLLEGVDDPVAALKFVNNLMQTATNVVSLNRQGENGKPLAIKDAQFLRKLVVLGFEIAKLNPNVITRDRAGVEEWLEIVWTGVGDSRQAEGGLAKVFDQLSTPQNALEKLTSQKQVERLDFLTKLVKAVELVDDPEVKLIARSSKHLSSLLDLGGSYAVLQTTANNANYSDASFLTLVAQGDLPAASDELERVVRGALSSFTYDVAQSVTATGNGQIQFSGDTFNNGARSRFGFNGTDTDPSNDRFSIAFRVRRANGITELPVPGDTYVRFYSIRGDVAGLLPGEIALYPGDTLLSPSRANDPFGPDRLGRLTDQDYAATERVLDAIRLAPYIAESEIREQISSFVQTVTDHPLLTGLALGGFVAAQFLQPAGVILNVGLILLGGWQAGFSLGSFFYKAATAQSQSQLWDASRELVNFFTNLADPDVLAPAGLLRLDNAAGLLNTTRILDAGRRLWREVDDLTRLNRPLSLSDALSIPFRVFENSNTAVGRLLQYGSASISEFLQRGFEKFTGGLPTIEGLTDFADRFKRVSEVAELLLKPENISVANALERFSEALRSVLNFDPRAAENAAFIDELVQQGISVTRERVIRIGRAPNGVVTKVNADGTVRTVDKIFLELGQHIGPNQGAGLTHILVEHADDFLNQGIPSNQLADVVMDTLLNGTRVGVQGSDGARVVYRYTFNNETKYMAITVGSNGFVVGANPLSSSFNP